MYKSRLSNIYSKRYSLNSSISYSNKKFALNYQPNYVLGSFAMAGLATNYFASFSGTDTTTGTSATDIKTYLNCTDPLVQTIVYKATDVASMLAVLESSVVSDIGPSGSLQNIFRVNFKDVTVPAGESSPPQSWHLFSRIGSPPPQLNEYYYSFYAKFDNSLATNLIYPSINNGSAWFSFIEMKTGGYLNDLNAGDYRYAIQIFRDADGLYFRCNGDNVADNSSGQKVVNSISPGGNPMVNSLYWKQRTVSGTVVTGVWCKLEVYIKRPVDNTDTTTGITWVAVTPMNTGIRQVICHKVGGTQKGIQNLPVGRMLIFGHYSGGVAPIVTDYTQLEFYDGFPYSPAIRSINNIMYDY